MKKLAIGEVSKRVGIAASAIRYYEGEGLLPRAARVNGRRVYDKGIVDRLIFIDLAKRAGFTVAEIRKLLSGFARSTPVGARWRALAERKMEELDRRIHEAQTMKRTLRTVMDCACPTFDDCARAMVETGKCSREIGSSG